MNKNNEELNEELSEDNIEETQESAEVEEEETLEDKLKEQTDKYMRLYAEFDNFQKRTQREKDMRYIVTPRTT